jgi:MscS family membrane protein
MSDAPPPEETTAATQVVEMLSPTLVDTPWTGWAILFGAILAGLGIGKLAKTILRRIATRLEARRWLVRATTIRSAAGPAALAVFVAALGLGLQAIVIRSAELRSAVAGTISFLNILAIAWFLFNLVDLVELALQRFTAGSAGRLDRTVVPLIRKALRIFLLIVFALFIAENVFEQDITAWLAGLGIAGLAVSLAAQDSIKNLFGSLTVLIERPFSLGDRIMFGGFDGTVEAIGFRSTRIRTMAGHLVTVPNMRFTDGTIENITARPFIGRTVQFVLAPETTAAKAREALEVVRRALGGPELGDAIRVPDREASVSISGVNPDGITISVSYAYAINDAGRNWASYLAHAERMHLTVLEGLEGRGIRLAFLPRLPGLAAESARGPATASTRGP